MKVLYIITKSNWGGAQRHVYDLGTTMKERGHEVMVALGGEGALKQRLEGAGVPTCAISSLKRDISIASDTASLKQVFSIIRKFKPDILHLHSPKAAGLGSLAGRLLRVKNVIVTVHGWTWNEDRPFLERVSIVLVSWLTAIFAHRTIVISKRDLHEGRRLPWITNKLVLIPLGMKSSKLFSVAGAKQYMAGVVGMGYAEYSKKFVIGTIAELHPNKGLDCLAKAMSLIIRDYPQAVSVVIGGGQEKESLTQLIKDLGLEKNIFLVGYIENASEYLKAFRIFVLPSVKEGLPYVLMEAGAADVPVVATAVGGIPDLIEDGRTGILVQPKNVRDLSHAIQYSIDHERECKEYAANLKTKISSDFSLEKMIDSVLAIYTRP